MKLRNPLLFVGPDNVGRFHFGPPAPAGRTCPTTRQLFRRGGPGAGGRRTRTPWFDGYPARTHADWTRRRK